tara:strand:+ start:92 stop:478 length:387 start_codon:yes stop_codon:yes gene_type:complete
MAKIKKSFLTPKWLEVKLMYEQGTNGSDKYGTNFAIGGELDKLTREFVDIIGEFTHEFGWDCVIEGVKMDLWKERIWSLIENAGLLPDIAWKDDLAKEQAEKITDEANDDVWEMTEEELEEEIYKTIK